FNGRTFKDRAFVLLTGRSYFDSPAFDMVRGTGVDLHIVPIITGKVFYHRFSQCLDIPFTLEVMTPHAGRNTIYLVAAQCSVNTFLFIHDVLLLNISTFWVRARDPGIAELFFVSNR